MLNMIEYACPWRFHMFRPRCWTSRCFFPLVSNIGHDWEPSKNHINFQEDVLHQNCMIQTYPNRSIQLCFWRPTGTKKHLDNSSKWEWNQPSWRHDQALFFHIIPRLASSWIRCGFVWPFILSCFRLVIAWFFLVQSPNCAQVMRISAK